jgi:hypothetical protein
MAKRKTVQRIASPYWFEFDRTTYRYDINPDRTWTHVPVSTERLLAQVLTISFETQNVRVRAYVKDTNKYFGTLDMTIDEFFKNFEIYKKIPR